MAYSVSNTGGAELYRYNRTYTTGTELGYKDYNNGNDPFDSTKWTQVTTATSTSTSSNDVALLLSPNYGNSSAYGISSALTEICAGKTATFYVHATGGTYPKLRTDTSPSNNAGQFAHFPFTGGNPTEMAFGWGMYLRNNSSGTPFLSGSSADAEANHMTIHYQIME